MKDNKANLNIPIQVTYIRPTGLAQKQSIQKNYYAPKNPTKLNKTTPEHNNICNQINIKAHITHKIKTHDITPPKTNSNNKHKKTNTASPYNKPQPKIFKILPKHQFKINKQVTLSNTRDYTINKTPKPNQHKPKKSHKETKNTTIIHLAKYKNLHKKRSIYKTQQRRTLNTTHNLNNTTKKHQDKNTRNQTPKTNKNYLKRAWPTGLAQNKTPIIEYLYSTLIRMHTKNPSKPITKQTNTTTIIQNNNKNTQNNITYITNKHNSHTTKITIYTYKHTKSNNTPPHKHHTKSQTNPKKVIIKLNNIKHTRNNKHTHNLNAYDKINPPPNQNLPTHQNNTKQHKTHIRHLKRTRPTGLAQNQTKHNNIGNNNKTRQMNQYKTKHNIKTQKQPTKHLKHITNLDHQTIKKQRHKLHKNYPKSLTKYTFSTHVLLLQQVKTYKNQPIIFTSYTFHLQLLLLLSGDIETNPGPMPNILQTHPPTHRNRCKSY